MSRLAAAKVRALDPYAFLGCHVSVESADIKALRYDDASFDECWPRSWTMLVDCGKAATELAALRHRRRGLRSVRPTSPPPCSWRRE
jgi:hypothetical protein